MKDRKQDMKGVKNRIQDEPKERTVNRTCKKSGKRRSMSLTGWFVLESVIIAVISCMTYAFLDFLNNAVFHKNPYYDPIFCIGMILPMTLLIVSFSRWFSKSLRKSIDGLTDGLKAVANGNISVKLDEAEGGILREAYADFNKMEKELQSVQILRSDFVNNFSHEFKTPITSVKGFAELLQNPDISEEDRILYSRIIAEESERLANLANSTIYLSRLDAQEMITGKKYYRLDAQLRDCIAMLSAACEEKQIEIEADLASLDYMGNADLMKQLWINLINNAIRYTPENGHIWVRLKIEDGQARVSVEDSGIGIPEEKLPHIFDKYYQGDISHSKKGLGLGLAIAHRIVELCGGTIEVQSKKGEGSSFNVRLSLEKPES